MRTYNESSCIVSGGGTVSDNRYKILEATVDVVAKHGIRDLRLEEVAARAGVAVSLIFYHFGNRIDLLRAVFQHVSEHSPSTVIEAGVSETALERIETSLVKEFKRPKARSYVIAWSELSAYAVFEPSLRKEAEIANQDWITNLENVIQIGQADGSIRAEISVHDEAEIITALVDGLVVRWISRSISAGRAVDLIRRMLRERLQAEVTLRRSVRSA